MKLLRLKADGFGPLRAEYRFDPERVALLVDENERGKSSLLAAVAAALYGLDDDRRSHRVLTPVERWRPWDGGSYRIELELESGGRRLTVTRDFERGTVAVWDDRGQEVTAEFREGRDEYPVGRKLLGLDAREFEKCAFVRQGELDQVVPAEERERRTSTLHARLENAADTRVGDTNAIEALRALEEAAAGYTCPELETTLRIETAIQRLEGKRDLLAGELRAIEHDLGQIAGPLEELARLNEAERGAREALGRLDAERRAVRLAGARDRLRQEDERRADLERLRAEAASLAAHAELPAGIESELREVVARLDEARLNLDRLETRRRESDEERARLEAEAGGLRIYDACEAADADRLAARAEEIRRLDEQHERLRAELDRHRAELGDRGYELHRADLLTARFGSLSPERQELLRSQPDVGLRLQTEVAAIEQARSESTTVLRAIDAARGARRAPGWLALAVGLGAALAAGVAGSLHTGWPWAEVLIAGVTLAAVGAALLAAGSRARGAEREAALARLREAEQRIERIRDRRAQNEARMAALAAALNYTSVEGLAREWAHYCRLIEESGPAQQTQRQIAALERQREELIAQARALLDRAGGGPADPAHLDLTAAGIRQLLAARQRLGEFERNRAWLDEQRRAAEADVAKFGEDGARALESAGVAHDPERPWTEHVQAVAARARDAARHALLVRDLIPQAEKLLLDGGVADDLRDEVERLEAEASPAPGPLTESPTDVLAEPPAERPAHPARTVSELESRMENVRGAIDELARRRGELAHQVEERSRRGRAEHVAKLAERERFERALARAGRFKQSLDLAGATVREAASDTHRRWAEYLNERVGGLLAELGAGVEQVRFGDDLDFSVRPRGAPQASRGKAMLQLSSGARDQLHLAVRLAVSEYLSRGREPLPLLIDDAFAACDDARARAGMNLLIGHLAPRHQVLLVTCHRRRHEALAALDPGLYGERVQWLDARTTERTERTLTGGRPPM